MKRTVTATLAALCIAGPAWSGTKGAVYDFNAMLNAPHPFAGARVGTVATVPSVVPVAPPAPTLRYVPVPAGRAVPLSAQPAPPARAPVSRRAAQAAAERAPLATPPSLDKGGGLFDRFYISFGGGIDFPDDLGGRTAAGNPVTTELDSGYALTMAFGRSFGESWRAEAELSYRQADYGSTVSGGTRVSGRGQQTVTGLLVNGFWDVNLGLPLVPFVGAGGGVAFISGDDVTVGSSVAPGRDSTEFAYQGIVGLGYDFGGRWHLVVDGRYFGTGDDDVASLSAGINLRVDL